MIKEIKESPPPLKEKEEKEKIEEIEKTLAPLII
jgi:hypothetical protein